MKVRELVDILSPIDPDKEVQILGEWNGKITLADGAAISYNSVGQVGDYPRRLGPPTRQGDKWKKFMSK